MTTPDAQGQPDPSGLALEPSGTGTETTTVPATPTENPIYWNELQTLPESVRPLVEPIFKEWDSNVGKRLQSVHSEYEPYKSLVDEWEPDALSQAVALAQALESDPAAFARNLIEAYQLDLGQGAASQSQPQTPPQLDDNSYIADPAQAAFQQQLAQQEQLVQAMAEAMIAERTQRAEEASQMQLDAVMTDLQSRHGAFDENYVLSLIAQNIDPEQAVGMFKQAVQQHAASLNAPQAPVVLGQGGGLPSNQVDPASLDDKSTKDLVVQMLRAANQQG